MAPPKFDDLSKPAKDVLGDDYQVDAKAFKSKMKTNFAGWSDLVGKGGACCDGATLTSAIDLKLGGKAGSATPTKLTWKFPKPLGFAGLAFDKLELDKAGKMKLEASMDKALHGVKDLKVECKSDLQSMNSLALGVTYTGISNALCKAEFKAMDPTNFTAEAGYSIGGGAALSVKSTKDGADIGAQYLNGPLAFSAISKEKFSAFSFHGFYKASGDLKVACSYDFGAKTNGNFAAGVGYACIPGMVVKGKLTGCNAADLAFSTSVKKEIAKGLTVTAGAKIPLTIGHSAYEGSWGVLFSIE